MTIDARILNKIFVIQIQRKNQDIVNLFKKIPESVDFGIDIMKQIRLLY